jgi:hypothetical protein
VNRRLFLLGFGGVVCRGQFSPRRVGLVERLRARFEWGLIVDKGDFNRIAILPYIEARFAHFSRDVMELKAAGIDHELFHVPSGTPIAAILPLFDGHRWTMPR